MQQRTRKLVGMVALVTLVVVYSLAAMTVAAAKLPGSSGWTQLVFFTVVGLAWVIPAGALISWMGKPDRQAS